MVGGGELPRRPSLMDFAAATQSVLGQVIATMGEPVTYTPAVGSPYSTTPAGDPLTGVFDEANEDIEPNSMTGVSSTRPVLLVRLSDLQAPPGKGDRVTVRTSRQFTVTKSEPDGRGGALLILHKV